MRVVLFVVAVVVGVGGGGCYCRIEGEGACGGVGDQRRAVGGLGRVCGICYCCRIEGDWGCGGIGDEGCVLEICLYCRIEDDGGRCGIRVVEDGGWLAGTDDSSWDTGCGDGVVGQV